MIQTRQSLHPTNQMKATTLKADKTASTATYLREIPSICGTNGKEWIIASYTKISQGWQLNRETVKYYLTKNAAEKAWAKMQKMPKTAAAKKEKSPTVVELKASCKEIGLKKYSKLKKAELIELLATYAA